jgi:CO/xanthine dehydrogenase Mo-binding subunit
MSRRHSIVGTSPPRVDALEKVTGAARFTEDFPYPGALAMKVLRSPLAHARVSRLDTGAAAQALGVVALVSRETLAGRDPLVGREMPHAASQRDRPLVAIDKVRYQGEPVVAVAAETAEQAEAALALVEVEYEELPAISDALQGLAEGASLLHEQLGTNLAGEYQVGWGDVDLALGRAAQRFDDWFIFPSVFHYPMEHAGLCVADYRDDRVELQAPHMRQFDTVDEIAHFFGLPADRVRVTTPFVGGGFGIKDLNSIEIIAVELSRQAGRPVRYLPTQQESFFVDSRHRCRYDVRSAVDDQGRLQALDVVMTFDAGAYLTGSMWVAQLGGGVAAGPYRVPNVRIRARCVYTNKVPSGAFRGFGTPQAAWGLESHLDRIARAIGHEPLEFRLANLLERGEQVVPGALPLDTDFRELCRKAAEAIGWSTPSGPDRGRGIACTLRTGGTSTNATYAEVTINKREQVLIRSNATEVGQGTRTILSQVVAEELGLPMAQIDVTQPDTRDVPYYFGTSSSRTTVAMGAAVQRATRDLKGELCQLAAAVHGGGPDDWRVEGGRLWCDDRSFALGATIGAIKGEATLVGRGSFYTRLNHESPWGGVNPYWEVDVGAAEVEVDRETGDVRLCKYVSVSDVGCALNPQLCKAQLQGGIVMGLGHTFHEELLFGENAELLNGDAAQYRLPLAVDQPDELISLMVEQGDGPGPFGAKGAGEATISAVGPAIGNAVRAATGANVRELPLTNERILRALGALGESVERSEPVVEARHGQAD